MADDDMWHPCNVTEAALEARVKGRLLCLVTDESMPEWLVPPVNDREPNQPSCYVVCFLSFLDQGIGIPAYRFMWALMHYYEVELAAVFATVCEGYLGIPPHWNLWLHLFKAKMSSCNEGGEKRPLRASRCTLQLRQWQSSLYIWSTMPLSNRGRQKGWFYLRNDHGLLLEYTRKMVIESPMKWGWGAPVVEQKKLDPLLEALVSLRREDVTVAMVAVTFHKPSLLPLAQRVVTMWEMMKALVWFWIIDETLILTSILSVCRLNEVGTCQVMEQVMIMVMLVMNIR